MTQPERPTATCPHCGEKFTKLSAGRIPAHDFPKPCRSICVGSGHEPKRNADAPLWKDDPAQRGRDFFELARLELRLYGFAVVKEMASISGQQSGAMQCPLCLKQVRFSVAPSNGHCAAKCETEGCIHAMGSKPMTPDRPEAPMTDERLQRDVEGELADLRAEVARLSTAGRAGQVCFACGTEWRAEIDRVNCDQAHREHWGHEWVTSRVVDLTKMLCAANAEVDRLKGERWWKLSNAIAQRDAALAQVAVMREALEGIIPFATDEVCNGLYGADMERFRVWSDARDRMQAALSGTAANALLAERDGLRAEVERLRQIVQQEPMGFVVLDGDKYDYRFFSDRGWAKDYIADLCLEEGEPDPEIIELVARTLRKETP